MTTPHLPTLGHQNGHDWPHKASTPKSSFMPAVLDPTLLHDLAEGLEFLNRQLDDAETELDRSREQSLAFEQDARRWEKEAARLRKEADELRQDAEEIRKEAIEARKDSEETREALARLRLEFEAGQAAALQQRQQVERVVAEMAEVRDAHTHLEELAAEQQRALVLSLELLRRVNEQAPPAAEPDLAALAAKDEEIAELKGIIAGAGEEGSRLDEELASAKAEQESSRTRIADLESELASFRKEREAAEAKAEALRAELASFRNEREAAEAKAEALRAELASFRNEREAAEAKAEALRAELASFRNEREAAGAGADETLARRVKELEQYKIEAAHKLQAAETEIALQNAEVESRGAIISALENALEEQNSSLRGLEERFLAYAEQVQSLQLQRLQMPPVNARSLASKFVRIFSPPKREESDE
jgi:chromosome segregation ATPase